MNNKLTYLLKGCFTSFLLMPFIIWGQVNWQMKMPIKHYDKVVTANDMVFVTSNVYDKANYITILPFNKEIEAVDEIRINAKQTGLLVGAVKAAKNAVLCFNEGAYGILLSTNENGAKLKEYREDDVFMRIKKIVSLGNQFATIQVQKDSKTGISVKGFDADLNQLWETKKTPEKGKIIFYNADSSGEVISVLIKDRKADPEMRLLTIAKDGNVLSETGITGDFDHLRITAFKTLADGSTAIATEWNKKGTPPGNDYPMLTRVIHINAQGETKQDVIVDYKATNITELAAHYDVLDNKLDNKLPRLHIVDFAIKDDALIAWGESYYYFMKKPNNSNPQQMTIASTADYYAMDAVRMVFKNNSVFSTQRISKPFVHYHLNTLTGPSNHLVLEKMKLYHGVDFVLDHKNPLEKAYFIGCHNAIDYVGIANVNYNYEDIAKRRYFGRPDNAQQDLSNIDLTRTNGLVPYDRIMDRGLLKSSTQTYLYQFDRETNVLSIGKISE
jgi:hypothetical protein